MWRECITPLSVNQEPPERRDLLQVTPVQLAALGESFGLCVLLPGLHLPAGCVNVSVLRGDFHGLGRARGAGDGKDDHNPD